MAAACGVESHIRTPPPPLSGLRGSESKAGDGGRKGRWAWACQGTPNEVMKVVHSASPGGPPPCCFLKNKKKIKKNSNFWRQVGVQLSSRVSVAEALGFELQHRA